MAKINKEDIQEAEALLRRAAINILGWKNDINSDSFPTWSECVNILMGERFAKGPWLDATTEDLERLKLLGGPHGYTIWKAMEAKREKGEA